MHQEQRATAAALCAVDFKFNFQITVAKTRHACSVTIQAVHDATAIFRSNSPTIENLAHQNLAADDRSNVSLEAVLSN
jgi:hypothetical protein